MSTNMLEQAILDAKSLRESALKTAELAVVEKYSNEVRDAVEKLLEQDGDMSLDTVETTETEETPTVMEKVPMAHLSEEGDQVVVDLENILAAADEVPSDEEYEQDLDTVADNIDVSLDSDEEETAPGNRDDEIDINEEDLISLFKEMTVVDVPQVELDKAQEALTQDQLEQDEEEVYTSTDGMDLEDIKELERTRAKFMGVQEQNEKLRTTLKTLKGKLEELLLQNARLLYANRVLNDTSLNEQQKSKVAELVGSAKSVEEAKTIFETLQKTMAETRREQPAQSLSEVVTRRSSVVLAGRRSEEETTTDANPTYNRWATLAGTHK
jgi:hypothetical protein